MQDTSLVPELKESPTTEAPKVLVDTHKVMEPVMENENKPQTEKERSKRHSIKPDEGKDISPRVKEKGNYYR